MKSSSELPADWLATLSAEEQQLARIAAIIEERVEIVGGCYLLTFFLHQFLKHEMGIGSKPIVGWVNDGTFPIMASHAWLEFNGKKTDISLTRTEFPEVQLIGPLLILDRVIRPGRATYSYHLCRTAEALDAARTVAIDPEQIGDLERLHLHMAKISKSEVLMKDYLHNAPSDRTYQALSRLIR